MKKSWFLPGVLASRLVRMEVSNREASYLALAGLLLATLLYYSSIPWGNPPGSWLFFYEFIVVIALNIYGFSQAYNAGGGDKNSEFIKQYVCLSVPIWLWTNVIVWTVYWSGIWLYRKGVLAAYDFQGLAIAKNILAIGGSFNWLWTFLAIVALQLIYFGWLKRSFKSISGARQESLANR